LTGKERAPPCPACGSRMTLARVIPRAYGRYRLCTYECEACKLSYSEAEADEEQGPE